MPLKPLHAYFVATGSWFLAFGLQSVLFAYLVTLVLHESAERVGFAQMAYLIPGTLLMLLGGSVADHFGGRRIAIIGQLLAALMAAGLALTMWLTELTYPLFILFAISMGCAQAILTPARDGLLPVVAGGMIQRRVPEADTESAAFQWFVDIKVRQALHGNIANGSAWRVADRLTRSPRPPLRSPTRSVCSIC